MRDGSRRGMWTLGGGLVLAVTLSVRQIPLALLKATEVVVDPAEFAK